MYTNCALIGAVCVYQRKWEAFFDMEGEVIAKAGDKVTAELADAIQNAAVPYVFIQTESRNVKVLSNMMQRRNRI